MSLAALLSFTLSAIILAIAPGPDNIFVLTQSAMHGYKKGLAVVIGLTIGICIQSFCMVAGITALFIAIPALVTILKTIGALYLSYLCIKATKSFIKRYRSKSDVNDKQVDTNTSAQDVYSQEATTSKDQDRSKNQDNSILNFKMIRRGIIMNCTNPKVQLFFLSFFPQFLPQSLGQYELMFYMSIMGLIMAMSTFVVFGSIAIFAGKLAEQFKTRLFNLILDGFAALIFAALALYTLASEFL